MLRTNWSFEYTASKLAEAAIAKRDHHRERKLWWEDQKDRVMIDVKESGIEVSESIATLYSNTSAMNGPQVMVNTDMQRKLTECFNKIKEHDSKVYEFDGWAQVLAAHPEQRMCLNQDDWLFFFSRN